MAPRGAAGRIARRAGDGRGGALRLRLRTGFRWRAGEGGLTFVELVIVAAIVMILASAALPLSKVTVQRQKEIELRRALREMRTAIDRYKDAADLQQIANFELEPQNMGYPPKLEVLVEGVTRAGDASGVKLRFLRRIPRDPMTGEAEWGMRSYQDRPDSRSWGGQNVFDVYSRAQGTGLDGTDYSDW
jgi:general secretion pathway protein G